MRRPLKVTNIQGELTRFLVASQREGVSEYLVDLTALDGNACCGCENFEHRILPLVRAQQKMPREQRIQIGCIHIYDARNYFLNNILWHLKDDENKNRH